MIGIAKPTGLLRQKAAQKRLSFDQRSSRQVFAVQFEKVEGDIVDSARIALQRALKRLEAGAPLRVEHDGLAVEKGGFNLQTRGGLDDARELLRPVEA